MEYLRGLHKYKFFKYSAEDPLQGSIDITTGIEKYSHTTIGVSFFKRKHNFCNFRFTFGISLIGVYLICVVTSTYHFRNEIMKLINCFTTFGFCCQAIMKIYCFIVTRPLVVHLYEINRQYYERVMDLGEGVKSVLCKNCSLIYIVIKGTGLVYFILVVTTLSMAGLISFFLPERMLPFGFVVPFVTVDTWQGYAFTYILQCLIAIEYMFLTIGTDITTIYNLLTAYGQLDVLITLIDELNELLDRGASPETIRDKIVLIIQLHQHHRSYLQELVDFLNPYHLVTLGSTVPTMIVTVLGLVMLNWYPGIVMMWLGSVQIAYICFLGTSLEIKTDALTIKVGEVNWHKLSVRDMKYMNLVLAMSQQPKMLMVAMTPLNITAYVQIHKMIYSMIMMLENTKG